MHTSEVARISQVRSASRKADLQAGLGADIRAGGVHTQADSIEGSGEAVRDWAAVDGALPGQHSDEEHERRPEHDLDDARHGLRRAGGRVDGGETGPMQAVRRAQTSSST